MSLFRIGDRHPDYKQQYFEGTDLKGLSVYSADNEKAGYVVDILLDEADAVVYLVLSVGSGLATWFGDRKKVVLPAAYYGHNQAENRISVRHLSQARIKALPAYENNQGLSAGYEAELQQSTRQLEAELVSSRVMAEAMG
ncbi:MAG: PRC-barrel domain-containing protein [Phormidesmis sp.]